MQQATLSNQNYTGSDARQFRYGGGIASISLGIVFVLLMLYAYEPMTSGRIEWHLFLKSLPVIPREIMIGIWWAGIVIAVLAIILSLMPAVKVVLDNEKIVAQSIYTRKFKTIYYNDILDAVYHKNYISITDRNNNKIYLAKLFLTSGSFRQIADTLRSSARNAH
ncbi:hypothetical protein ACN9MF_20045 [Methylobacterium fujisawaense]|uniref:hypothetical protein n=1 Tax=Methylobacterium fujisawaense TaxID=107400 RepID=UPI003CF2D9BC